MVWYTRVMTLLPPSPFAETRKVEVVPPIPLARDKAEMGAKACQPLHHRVSCLRTSGRP